MRCGQKGKCEGAYCSNKEERRREKLKKKKVPYITHIESSKPSRSKVKKKKKILKTEKQLKENI